MESKHEAELTSAEISNTWTSYMYETMVICGLKYFIAKTESDDIRSVLSFALEKSQNHVQALTEIFKVEGYPVPKGFKDQDVNTEAPRLFSDTFFLVYILSMAKFMITINGVSISTSARLDIVDFYSGCINDAQELHRCAKKLTLEKGVYIRPPHIPKHEQVDFVNSQSFLTGWFGERRPLLGVEISNLTLNIKRNALGKALIIGFSQVAQSKDVRKYMERGRDISQKHMEVFSSLLNEEHLPSPRTWDHAVTASKVSPFSDKLMMFHITTLTASGIGQYGMSASMSPRRDLGVQYARLATEIGKYSEDGANIMIKHGWMEQPPQSVDRKELAKNKD
jgi:hypothetical protein